MIGAIIGDVVGSVYETLEYNSKEEKRSYEDRMKIMDNNTPLFLKESVVTDDSVLTVAVMDAIINNKKYDDKLKEYAIREINEGRNRFGSGFLRWVNGENKIPSIGNGCAMRISPVGFLFNDLDTIKEESRKVTITSHNNDDCIKCAEAIAVSIYLLRKGMDKDSLRKYIIDNYFDLDYDLEDLRHNYTFEVSAIKSVPQAIYCFLESNDFEDGIRKAISIGGDSDTIACIVGALSETYYGVSNEMIKQVEQYLLDYMKPILVKVYGNIFDSLNKK